MGGWVDGVGRGHPAAKAQRRRAGGEREGAAATDAEPPPPPPLSPPLPPQDPSEDRRFHIVITAQGSAVHWQSRVHYYW